MNTKHTQGILSRPDKSATTQPLVVVWALLAKSSMTRAALSSIEVMAEKSNMTTSCCSISTPTDRPKPDATPKAKASGRDTNGRSHTPENISAQGFQIKSHSFSLGYSSLLSRAVTERRGGQIPSSLIWSHVVGSWHYPARAPSSSPDCQLFPPLSTR